MKLRIALAAALSLVLATVPASASGDIFSTFKPDLLMVSVQQGSTSKSLIVQIKNQGVQPLTPASGKCKLSMKVKNYTTTYWADVPSIPAGGTAFVTISSPYSLMDSYAYLVVDATHKVSEKNENNNEGYVDFYIE